MSLNKISYDVELTSRIPEKFITPFCTASSEFYKNIISGKWTINLRGYQVDRTTLDPQHTLKRLLSVRNVTKYL